MHRSILALPLVLCLAVSPSAGQPEKKPEIRSFPTDLYPLKVGNRWLYKGADPKEKVSVVVERMEPVRRREAKADRADTIESFILRITSGDKALHEQIMVTEDGIYRFAAAGKEIKPPLKIMKLPAAKLTRGESWAVDSISGSVDLKGDFIVEQVSVNLGKGDEPAWLSKTRDFKIGDQPMEASYWFKPGVGIVKQHVKSGKFDFNITLEEFRPAAGADLLPGLPKLPTVPPLESK